MNTCGNCHWWLQIYEDREGGLRPPSPDVYGTCGWYDPQVRFPHAYVPLKIHRDHTHCPCHVLKKV